MPYKTINDLPIRDHITVQSTDNILMSSNLQSYKMTVAELSSRISSNVIAPSGHNYIIINLQTISKNLLPNSHYIIDTSGGPFTVILPTTMNAGDRILIMDAAGTWSTNVLTIDPGTNTIMTVAGVMTMSVSNVTTGIVWNGSDWRIE